MSISLERLANRIMRQYDHDRNGTIDLKTAGSGNARRDETLRLKQGDGETEVMILGSYGSAMVSKDAYTRGALFRDADANGDGHVTRQELINRIAISDIDHNGRLCNYDRPEFDKKYGEKLYRKDVRVPSLITFELSGG